MQLKLTLFIDGEQTWVSCDYPLKPNMVIDDPVSTYIEFYGLDKQSTYPDNVPDIESINYEYKIVWGT